MDDLQHPKVKLNFLYRGKGSNSVISLQGVLGHYISYRISILVETIYALLKSGCISHQLKCNIRALG